VELLDELAFKRGGYDVSMLTEIHSLTVDKLVSEEEKALFGKCRW